VPLQQGAECGRHSRDLKKNPVKLFLKKIELNSYIFWTKKPLGSHSAVF